MPRAICYFDCRLRLRAGAILPFWRLRTSLSGLSGYGFGSGFRGYRPHYQAYRGYGFGSGFGGHAPHYQAYRGYRPRYGFGGHAPHVGLGLAPRFNPSLGPKPPAPAQRRFNPTLPGQDGVAEGYPHGGAAAHSGYGGGHSGGGRQGGGG